MTTKFKRFNNCFLTFVVIALSVSIGFAVPSVTVVNPNGGDVGKTGDVYAITWSCTGQGANSLATIEYSIDNGTNYAQIATNVDGGVVGNTSYNWTLPYHYSFQCLVRVTVVDPDDGNSSDSDVSDAVFTLYTTTSTHRFYQGWSLMSLPHPPDSIDKDDIIGDDLNQQWQLFGFEPDRGYYFPDTMARGEAYWLAVVFDDSIDVDMQGEASIVPYTYDLDIAWNFIGYPFPNSYDINDMVFTRNSVDFTLAQVVDSLWVLPIFYTAAPELGNWGYWLNFGPVTTVMAHWRGYWFLTMVDSLQMTLDPVNVTPGPPAGWGPDPWPLAADEATQDEWGLTLLVGTEETICSALRLGSDTNASDEFDLRFDFPVTLASPEPGPVNAYFQYENWQDYFNGDRYLRDIRDILNDEVAEWTLTIEGQGEVIVRWPGISEDTPEDYQFTLEDPLTHRSLDMRDEEEYIFESQDNVRELVVHVYASPYEAPDEIPAPLPTESSIQTIYPNPFNSEVTIAYNLASASDVVVSVHDLTGRAIAVLTDNHQPAGSYTSIWNADDMSTGVYLVRVATSDFSSVRKVVLVK